MIYLVVQMVKNLPAIEETGFDPWLGRSPEEGNGYPLQYAFLKNSIDRGVWQAIVHAVVKSWPRLNN